MSQGSGEKTEKASPKKKKDAREKGEVHKSADLNSALTLLLLFGTLKVGYDGFVASMRDFFTGALSRTAVERSAHLTAAAAAAEYKSVLLSVLPAVLPFLLAAMLAGALVHILQTGPMFVPAKLRPDFGKIDPIAGFQRIFSPRSLVELFKSVVKIAVLGYLAWREIQNGMSYFVRLAYTDVGGAFSQIMSSCFSLGMTMGLALVVFAVLDAFYQWWKYEKDLMMTKQEVKEESKQTEGDPQVKGKIRQKQRKMSAMRMMQHLPEASVVITNPTHFAVALRYRESEDKAPVVVAKGQDHLALRIKKQAAKHRISVVENRAVARALYASCEVGDEIPPELYQAIADILIYVYKTMGKNF